MSSRGFKKQSWDKKGLDIFLTGNAMEMPARILTLQIDNVWVEAKIKWKQILSGVSLCLEISKTYIFKLLLASGLWYVLKLGNETPKAPQQHRIEFCISKSASNFKSNLYF